MKVAISIGDLNGIGIEIAFKSHNIVKELCEPIYCINEVMLKKASLLLKMPIPYDFEICNDILGDFEIEPSKVTKLSGKFSFDSFLKAVELTKDKKANAVVTLPINKESWFEAGVKYKGHTEALRDIFSIDAIMMLGNQNMYVVLYTEHIPFREIVGQIQEYKLTNFFLKVYEELKVDNFLVLGINPHCGDNGVLGGEDLIIKKAIENANRVLKQDIFKGPAVPDIAFTPKNRDKYEYFIAMYHDQGLIPLKALYFDESINVSLNLPIIRTSVDHGTAFDIAYKDKNPNNLSYINAIKEAIRFSQ